MMEKRNYNWEIHTAGCSATVPAAKQLPVPHPPAASGCSFTSLPHCCRVISNAGRRYCAPSHTGLELSHTPLMLLRHVEDLKTMGCLSPCETVPVRLFLGQNHGQ